MNESLSGRPVSGLLPVIIIALCVLSTSLSGSGHAATLVDLDFANSLTNTGTTGTATYKNYLDSGLNPNPVYRGGGEYLLLVPNEGVELSGVATELIENDFISVSGRFMIKSLPESGRGAKPLFDLIGRKVGTRSKEDGAEINFYGGVRVMLMRDGEGLGWVKLTISDADTNGLKDNRNSNSRVAEGLPLNKWIDMRVTIDIEQRFLTTQFNDQYFVKRVQSERFNWETMFNWVDSASTVKIGWSEQFNSREVEKEQRMVDSTIWLDNYQLVNARPAPVAGDISGYTNALAEFTNRALQNSLSEDDISTLEAAYLDIQRFITTFGHGHYLDAGIKASVDSFMQAVEASPIYPDPVYANLGNRRDRSRLEDLPVMLRALVVVQQDILLHNFTNPVVPTGETADGKIDPDGNLLPLAFKAHRFFPGEVTGVTNHDTHNLAGSFWINGTYERFEGVSKYAYVRRPTGYYVLPGQIAKVCLPVSDGVNISDFRIFVGAHQDFIGSAAASRYRKIGTRFNFDTHCQEVANPFGGGLYIGVRPETQSGWFEVDVDGGVVEAPFFDVRSNNRPQALPAKSTDADWSVMVNTAKAPWTDLESDNFQITVPTATAKQVTDPTAVMQKWDEMWGAVSVFTGRGDQNLVRPRPEWALVDNYFRKHGYPNVMESPRALLGNPRGSYPHNLTYKYGYRVFNITQAPDAFQKLDILLHGFGHGLRSPMIGSEGESHPNLVAIAMSNSALGISLDEAIKYSNGQRYGRDHTAIDWMIRDKFRNGASSLVPLHGVADLKLLQSDSLEFKNADMTGTFKHLDLTGSVYGLHHLMFDGGLDDLGVAFRVRNNGRVLESGRMPGGLRSYANRALGKYLDLVDIYGWSILGDVAKEFYTEWDKPGNIYELYANSDVQTWRRHDDWEYIDMAIRAFAKLPERPNPLPLLEFWGVVPTATQIEEAKAMGLVESTEIYDRLRYYESLIPATELEFDVYRQFVLANMGKTVQGLYEDAYTNWNTDSGYAAQMQKRLNDLFSTYFSGNNTPLQPRVLQDVGCSDTPVYIHTVKLTICNSAVGDVPMTDVSVVLTDTANKVVYDSGVIAGPFDQDKGVRVYHNTLLKLIETSQVKHRVKAQITAKIDGVARNCSTRINLARKRDLSTPKNVNIEFSMDENGCTAN